MAHRYKGKELWYRDEGSGNPVLLVHGIGAASHVWRSLIDAEKQNYRFIAVDLPCTGSSKDYCRARAEEITPALVDLLDALKISRAVVVGHSYGGVLAIDFAAKHPGRVSGVVVMSAPALGLPGQLKQLLSAPASEWAVKVLARLPNFKAMVKSYLSMAFGDPKRLTDPMVAEYLEAMKAEGFYPALLEALRDVANFVMPVEQLRKNRVPARALWGDQDRLVSVIQGEQVARALDADLEVLHGIGHVIPQEAPEAVAEAISRLADKPRAKAAE